MADEIFDESHYFMCSGGLKPARFKSSQKIMTREDENYYLTEYSLTCKGIDFSCKWTALLAAIIAAAIALLMASGIGMVLLAAVAGAVVGAGVGAAICGHKAAVIRTWIVIKENAQIEDLRMVSNQQPIQLNCKLFSNTITYKPNVTNEWEAMFIFAGNTLMTGLEGFMYVYAFRGGGTLLTKPMTFLRNFGANYLKTISVKGAIGRSIFGVWGGANAYYMSDTEGFDAEQVAKASAQSFFFAETAMYHAATEADPQSIALLLSMGGIPGGKNGRDAGKGEVMQEAKTTAESWKNASQKVKSGVNKAIDTAKEFREKLKSQKKGDGAHEKPTGGKNPNSITAEDGYRKGVEHVEPGTRSIEEASFTKENITKVEEHLSQELFLEEGELAANNQMMIERLKAIERGELDATATDKSFLTHEMRESELMKDGLGYDEAHAQTCKEYGFNVEAENTMNNKAGPFYTEEAIKAWDEQVKRNLGF